MILTASQLYKKISKYDSTVSYKAINKAYRCYVYYKSTNNKDYLEEGCRYLTVIYNKTRYEKKFFSDNDLFTNKILT